MEQALAELRAAVEAAGIPLDVRGGGEIDLGKLVDLSAEERARLGLGGNPRVLLLEFPYSGWPLGLEDAVFQLALDGVTPVLAHPERNREVQEAPERLQPLVRAGAVVQLTAASVEGRDGTRLRSVARGLLDRGLAHLMASDAHIPTVRSPGLAFACSTLGDEALARWLTADVPSALLESRPLPERPPRPARRGWRERLRR
jgi:protein-tyrosine phosphatase